MLLPDVLRSGSGLAVAAGRGRVVVAAVVGLLVVGLVGLARIADEPAAFAVLVAAEVPGHRDIAGSVAGPGPAPRILAVDLDQHGVADGRARRRVRHLERTRGAGLSVDEDLPLRLATDTAQR